MVKGGATSQTWPGAHGNSLCLPGISALARLLRASLAELWDNNTCVNLGTSSSFAGPLARGWGISELHSSSAFLWLSLPCPHYPQVSRFQRVTAATTTTLGNITEPLVGIRTVQPVHTHCLLILTKPSGRGTHPSLQFTEKAEKC